MARKYVPKDLKKGKGIISRNHTVATRGGGTLKVSQNLGVTNKGMGLLETEDAKRRILNRLPQQEGRIKTLISEAMFKTEKLLQKADASRVKSEDGTWKVVKKSLISSKITDIVGSTVKKINHEIVSNIQGSIKTYLIGLRRDSKTEFLSMSEINEISKKKALQIYRQKVGKDKKTTPHRVAAMGVRLETELYKTIDQTHTERFNGRKGLRRRLLDPRGSNIPCVARGVARINRTEQNRGIHEAVIGVLEDSDVPLAYWRLSASHKDYGGGEICEVLSTNTGGGVESVLANRNIIASTSGLYTVSDFPMIPHPNCMCSIEPLFA